MITAKQCGISRLNDQDYYMRNPRLVVITTGTDVILINERGESIDHATLHASRWSLLMQRLSNPLSGAAMREYIASLPDFDNELCDRLLASEYLLRSRQAEHLKEARDRVFTLNQGYYFAVTGPVCEHLVLGCTGSVVSGLMAPTILSLCHSGFQRKLDTILTESAQKFITRDLLESYGVATWTDAFERREETRVPHVQLGRSADCILIMPATANTLHRLAAGACSDLLSLTVAASTAPVVLAPAMNETMWNNQAVQRNVQRLRDDGMYLIEPTRIFGAADLGSQDGAMYGGHGTLWAGPGALMHALTTILQHHTEGLGDKRELTRILRTV